MECQYCKSTLLTVKSLKQHQKKAKKCLDLRGLLVSEDKKDKNKCQNDNCDNPRIPRGKYCEMHRTRKEICIVLDCNSNARGGGDTCKLHGGGPRCTETGCKNSARIKGGKCETHGGGYKCTEFGCTNNTNKKGDKCVTHGGGNKCTLPGCKNTTRIKGERCGRHGGRVQLCRESDCEKYAKRGGKCKSHGGGNRCPNCINWPDSRCGWDKYDGYCATCFKRVFPNDQRSKIIYSHTKEIKVRNAITEYAEINKDFEGFIHDISLYTGNCDCTHRRRIDHRKLFGNTILAVETDEFAHNRYDKKDEDIRYNDLYMIHSGKWIFIRFNPDHTPTDKTDIEDRIIQLLEEIEVQIERIYQEDNHDLVEIIKMFY